MDAIRYYELEGIIGTVPRQEIGIHDFGQHSLNQLRSTKVTRDTGMAIEKNVRVSDVECAEIFKALGAANVNWIFVWVAIS